MPSPCPSNTEDGVGRRVGGDHVHEAVALEIAHGHRPRAYSGGEIGAVKQLNMKVWAEARGAITMASVTKIIRVNVAVTRKDVGAN